MKRERGQSLVEGAMVLLIFVAMVLGVVDCGQVLFVHQSLVERARSAARWGSLHKWEGPEPIVGLVLQNQSLGLTAENVQVDYRPDRDTLSVQIVNYRPRFFSPWLAGMLGPSRPVRITAPITYSGSWLP